MIGAKRIAGRGYLLLICEKTKSINELVLRFGFGYLCFLAVYPGKSFQRLPGIDFSFIYMNFPADTGFSVICQFDKINTSFQLDGLVSVYQLILS